MAVVPLDYAHPAGTKISIAVVKHPATDPAHRIGSLFFNPGGPGDPGIAFLRQGYSLFPPAVRARFDLVSFDPRGIGLSTVLQCFASNEQERQLLGPVASEGYPADAAQQRAWENTYARFDKACAAHAGPLLAHDSTADTARDMDLLRRAVGDPTLCSVRTARTRGSPPSTRRRPPWRRRGPDPGRGQHGRPGHAVPGRSRHVP